MFWYLVILSAVFLFGLIGREKGMRGVDASRFVLIGCCSVLAVFAMLRHSSVGADTDSYEALFSWVQGLGFDEVLQAKSSYWFFADSDPLYRLYNKFIGLFTDDPRAVTVANSAITIIAFAALVKRQSFDPWLSVLLFVCLGLYQLSINLAPSFMASLIALCGVPYIESRRFARYALCVALGSVFHPAALVMLAIYPLARIRLNPARFWLIVAIGAICATVGYPYLLSLVSQILPDQYLMYLDGKEFDVEKLAVWLLQFALFLVCYFSQKNRKAFFRESNVGLWIFLVETVLYFFTMQSSGLNRAAFLFMPYVVILIPNMLKQATCFWRGKRASSMSKLNGKFVSRHMNLTKLVVIAICLVGYIVRMSVNNIGQTMPYEFFF